MALAILLLVQILLKKLPNKANNTEWTCFKNKMQHILCTGNMCSKQQYDDLKMIAPNVHVVRVDFDEETDFPEEKVVQIGRFKIGLCHGHQVVPWGDAEALSQMQRRLDVDILITGHTHKNRVEVGAGGKWFINPGSITGAYNGFSSSVAPSFILMSVKGLTVTTYVYELEESGKLNISKTEFTKEEDVEP